MREIIIYKLQRYMTDSEVKFSSMHTVKYQGYSLRRKHRVGQTLFDHRSEIRISSSLDARHTSHTTYLLHRYFWVMTSRLSTVTLRTVKVSQMCRDFYGNMYNLWEPSKTNIIAVALIVAKQRETSRCTPEECQINHTNVEQPGHHEHVVTIHRCDLCFPE